MGKVTNDERRRVAKALREYASFDCEDEGEEECLVDCADWGERVLNLLGCGDTEGENYAYLADLIDPDTTADTTKSQTISLSSSLCDHVVSAGSSEVTPKYSEVTPKCDRDALLALAEECDEMRDDGCSIGSYELYRIARRIREACGVTSDA